MNLFHVANSQIHGNAIVFDQYLKGSRSKVENYRCIAKLPTIAKFFEYLVNIRLTRMIEHDITPRQFGFMRKRSTNGNLMEFVHFSLKAIHDSAQIDCLYTDFSKAFDKVDHSKLITKLNKLNIPSNLTCWIQSYLSNRRQFVNYGQINSNDFIVNSGVPQGSHLGPTLFLIFINDIVQELGDDVFISLFAHDLKIAMIIKDEMDCYTLQAAIDNKCWCDTNDLHLNLDKCAVLTITRKQKSIEHKYYYGTHEFKRVNEQRDLGVIIDRKLNFVEHLNSIASKASAALGFIKRFCYDLRDTKIMKSLYSALVQSHLEYCSSVWLPHYEVHKNKIESILIDQEPAVQ